MPPIQTRSGRSKIRKPRTAPDHIRVNSKADRDQTGRDVAHPILLAAMSRARLLFYSMCIKANRHRYSYKRQANRSLKNLKVPDLDALPSYVEASNVDRFAGRDTALAEGAVLALDVASLAPSP